MNLRLGKKMIGQISCWLIWPRIIRLRLVRGPRKMVWQEKRCHVDSLQRTGPHPRFYVRNFGRARHGFVLQEVRSVSAESPQIRASPTKPT